LIHFQRCDIKTCPESSRMTSTLNRQGSLDHVKLTLVMLVTLTAQGCIINPCKTVDLQILENQRSLQVLLYLLTFRVSRLCRYAVNTFKIVTTPSIIYSS